MAPKNNKKKSDTYKGSSKASATHSKVSNDKKLLASSHLTVQKSESESTPNLPQKRGQPKYKVNIIGRN